MDMNTLREPQLWVVDEPEYPDVLIFEHAVAVRFDDRSPYLVLTPDGAVSECRTLGGVA